MEYSFGEIIYSFEKRNRKNSYGFPTACSFSLHAHENATREMEGRMFGNLNFLSSTEYMIWSRCSGFFCLCSHHWSISGSFETLKRHLAVMFGFATELH